MKKAVRIMAAVLFAAAVLSPALLFPGTARAASGKEGLVKEGSKYFYYEDGSKVKNQWITVDGSKYYFGSKGAAATGSTKIGKDYYIFGSKGKLLTGKSTVVKKIAGTFCQIAKDGKAKPGWDSKKVYCYAKNGTRIYNGWSTDKKYYLGKKGKKCKGIIVTGGLAADGETWVTPKFACLDKKTGLLDKALTKKLNKLAQYEKKFAPVKKIIGEPKKATYQRGCYDGPEINGKQPYEGGKDGHLTYKNFEIDTYKAPDGTEFFISFAIDL